ncbi:Histone deacetylase hda1 [Elasticomyces elasticus]|nr:Histone deacetylase hda1 [Elasticomyces elasticus]
MDIIMDGIETEILASTELNGHDVTTLDPSVLAVEPLGPNAVLQRDTEEHGAFSPALNLDDSPPEEFAGNSNGVAYYSSRSSSTASSSIERPKSPVVVVYKKAKFKPLPYATSQTGLVYDPRMRFHCEPLLDVPCPSCPISTSSVHPEDPQRIWAIYRALQGAKLVADPGNPVGDPALDYYMGRITARMATMQEICQVHTREHYQWVQGLEMYSDRELHEMAEHKKEYDSVYFSKNTFDCARLSAGSAIEVCRAVCLRYVKNAIAVIRPPGHHAEGNSPMGFCFFNNVCIAARACQDEFGQHCRKVLILDWDVHHGNGVQRTFYDDPNVLYISLHVHEDGNFYPRGDEGDHLHCGQGLGLGKNVNIPWPKKGMRDADYLYAFQHVVMPIAQEFNPDLVIVSAGFDAAEGDMLGGCHVSPGGYAQMTHMLMSLADGKVAVCLEGGYNLQSIANSALAVTRTLMGEPPDRIEDMHPSTIGVNTVKLVERQQSNYWQCLYPKALDQSSPTSIYVERGHDMFRSWQANGLWGQHGLTPLFVYNETLSRSFKDQVMATPSYREHRPLLVIFHEPSLVKCFPHPRTGEVEMHNLSFADNPIKKYVDWAIEQGFAVIDVNCPKHITQQRDTGGYVPPDDEKVRIKRATDLAAYLWDNYIEVNNPSHVFLLGMGVPHAGLINLVKSNDKWYYQSSLVFVPEDHHFFTEVKKIKRRWGYLIKTHSDDLNTMMDHYMDQVTDMFLEDTEEWRTSQMNGVKRELSHADDETEEPLTVLSPPVDPDAVPSLQNTPSRKLPKVGNFALQPQPQPQSPGARTPGKGRHSRSPMKW